MNHFFMGVLGGRLERVLNHINSSPRTNSGFWADVSTKVGVDVGFVEARAALEEELRCGGYSGSKLELSQQFHDLLVAHGLACGKIYMLYVVDFLNNLPKSKESQMQSKDAIFKAVDMKDFESRLERVWDDSSFTNCFSDFKISVVGMGYRGHLKDNPALAKLLKVHGVKFSEVYFDKTMKIWELVKRRVR